MRDVDLRRHQHRFAHRRRCTRLPSYARGKEGTVRALRPAHVFPDTAAHFLAENPQHVYDVAFTSDELWASDAEPATVTLDLYESYLEKAS
jgi:nitrile hydratase subunit beta